MRRQETRNCSRGEEYFRNKQQLNFHVYLLSLHYIWHWYWWVKLEGAPLHQRGGVAECRGSRWTLTATSRVFASLPHQGIPRVSVAIVPEERDAGGIRASVYQRSVDEDGAARAL